MDTLELIHNLASAVALGVLGLLLPFAEGGKATRKNLILGIYFGLCAIVVMAYSREIYPGMRLDARNALLALSGFQGGFVAAFASGIISASYRLFVGGSGATPGVFAIAWSSLCGGVFYTLIRKGRVSNGPLSLLALAFLVHIHFFITHPLMRGKEGAMILWQAWPVIFFIYPLGLYVLLLVARNLQMEKKRRHELILKEEFERAVLSSIHEGIISTDEKGKVLYMNPSAEVLTGWELKEARGRDLKDVFQILNEYTLAPVPDPVERVLKEGVVVGLGNHTLLRSKEGRVFPIADSASPIKLAGNLLGVVLVFKDQSQERNYLREIEASQRKLLAVFESIRDALFILTPEGQLVDCNKRALELFGLKEKDEFLKKRPAHFSPERQPDGRLSEEKADEIIRHVLSTSKSKSFEWLHQRADHSLFPAEVTITPFELDGRPMLLSVVRDITEKKKVYETLEQERAQMLSIFDGIDEIIYVSDPNTYEVLWANKKLKEVLGMDPTGEICYKAFQGKDAPCSFCTNEIIKQIRPNSFVWEYENPVLKRSYLITDRIIQWPDGRDVRFELAIDITEKKQAEQEKMRLQAQLAQAQKLESIGRLAGGIAHDFNNVLSVILGRAQLARRKTEDERIRKDLDQIIEATNRASGIIRQMLGFARKQSINPIPIDLNSVILHSLKVLGSILDENIRLRVVTKEGLWKVLMDPVQVDQILSNLMVNARDAIEGQGEIVITTENLSIVKDHPEFRPEMLPGDYVMLSVADTGHGIPEEIISKIFEPFFTTKEPGKGTGLGLATVYGIVKQNNGYIYVQSRPNEGAIFKIFLPRCEGEAQKKARPDETKAKLKGLEGKQAVLVEDSAQLNSTIAEMLSGLGLRVSSYLNPTEALAYLSDLRTPVDLLITDVVMPDMFGPELYRAIREFRPQMKVIFISGHADLERPELKAYEHLLMDAPKEGRMFLKKPFGLQELIKVISTLLGEGQ